MSESYKELLVKRKTTAVETVVRMLFGGGAGFLLVFGFLQFSLILMLLGLLFLRLPISFS